MARGRLMIAAPAFDQRDRARQRRAASSAQLGCKPGRIDGGGALRTIHGSGLQRLTKAGEGPPGPVAAIQRRMRSGRSSPEDRSIHRGKIAGYAVDRYVQALFHGAEIEFADTLS